MRFLSAKRKSSTWAVKELRKLKGLSWKTVRPIHRKNPRIRFFKLESAQKVAEEEGQGEGPDGQQADKQAPPRGELRLRVRVTSPEKPASFFVRDRPRVVPELFTPAST